MLVKLICMLVRGPMTYFETQTCATCARFSTRMGRSRGNPMGMEAIPQGQGWGWDLRYCLPLMGLVCKGCCWDACMQASGAESSFAKCSINDNSSFICPAVLEWPAPNGLLDVGCVSLSHGSIRCANPALQQHPGQH